MLPLLFVWQIQPLRAASADSARVEQLVRRAAAASVQGNYPLSDRYLFAAFHLADSLASPKMMFWTLTNLGINQAEQFNYADALAFFDKAEAVAERNLGRRQLLSIRSNRAGVYMLDRQYTAPWTNTSKSTLSSTKRSKNPPSAAVAHFLKNLYVERADTARARRYMEEAERLLAASAADRPPPRSPPRALPPRCGPRGRGRPPCRAGPAPCAAAGKAPAPPCPYRLGAEPAASGTAEARKPPREALVARPAHLLLRTPGRSPAPRGKGSGGTGLQGHRGRRHPPALPDPPRGTARMPPDAFRMAARSSRPSRTTTPATASP